MLDDIDRDLAIRTVLAEAGGEGPEGMAAVAAVIKNRMAAGRYGGRSAAEVVTAPNQFEPWNKIGAGAKNDPTRFDRKSDAYAAAARIVDGVFGGGLADPTGGATHFYAPVAQAELGRNAPSWAKGPSKRIGGHMFFAPDGSVSDLAQGMGNIGQDPNAPLPPMASGSGATPMPLPGLGGGGGGASGQAGDPMALLRKMLLGAGGGLGMQPQPQHGALNQLLFGPQGWQGHIAKALPNGLFGLLGVGQAQPQTAQATPGPGFPAAEGQPMQLPGAMPAPDAPAMPGPVAAAAGGPGLPSPAGATAGGPLGNGLGIAAPPAGGGFASMLSSLFGIG